MRLRLVALPDDLPQPSQECLSVIGMSSLQIPWRVRLTVLDEAYQRCDGLAG